MCLIKNHTLIANRLIKARSRSTYSDDLKATHVNKIQNGCPSQPPSPSRFTSDACYCCVGDAEYALRLFVRTGKEPNTFMFLVETLLHRRSTYIEQAGCCDTMDTRLNEENTLESRVRVFTRAGT